MLPAGRRAPAAMLLLREMVHFFALMLWVAAGLALLAGMPQPALAIVVVVVLNGAFAFVQEYRADKAGQRLRELIPADVKVVRDGHRVVVNAGDLVVGDVVLLEAGDRISADPALVEVHALAVNESMLTGESVPARPHEGTGVFAGTFVVEGEAVTVVAATGPRTRLAGVAALARSATRPPSPLARQLGRVVRVVAVIEVVLLLTFLGFPPLTGLLGGSLPPPAGWALAAPAASAVVATDTLHKAIQARSGPR
ncbi:hypothetical protein ABZV14_17130 [Streptosporangium canum]|uniref:P-type ATPase n=1 Tax=Streptosporangium canum TaxID=324952 RepID=UPI0033A0FDA3